MIHPEMIDIDREIYQTPEGIVLVISIICKQTRIERYFLINEIDHNTIEINQISTEMAFQLVRRK